MHIAELILLAIGLSMDAFAVSVCKGLSAQRVNGSHMLACGLWFGGFQALMPFLGYLLGQACEQYIVNWDHWVAFLLLSLIGLNMIKEAFSSDEESADASFGIRTMLPMAIATSIDALAIGITFGLLPDVDLPLALSLIGSVTFLLSALGVKVGAVFGARYRAGAEVCGGVILILLGIKILLEHLGVLAF